MTDLINQIHCGDCVEVMKSIPDESIDLTVTSPPYDALRDYKGYSFDFEAIAKQLFRVTKPGGVVVWIVGDQTENFNKTLTSFRQGLSFQEIGFNMFDVMIYGKRNTPYPNRHKYINVYEFMFVLSKGKPKVFNPLKERVARERKKFERKTFRQKDGSLEKKIIRSSNEKFRSNIWFYSVGGGSTSDNIAFKHPAMFPEKLALDHILSWTNKGDLVLDPMCGSGTTCKMATEQRRDYIGIDIAEEYVEIAKLRLRKYRRRLI